MALDHMSLNSSGGSTVSGARGEVCLPLATPRLGLFQVLELLEI